MFSLIFKTDLYKVNSLLLTGSRIPIRNTNPAPDLIHNIPAYDLHCGKIVRLHWFPVPNFT
jgi:hypothetical protein